jgi:hypothetical protein
MAVIFFSRYKRIEPSDPLRPTIAVGTNSFPKNPRIRRRLTHLAACETSVEKKACVVVEMIR